MTQKTYIVEGRQFRTEVDYRRALRDKQVIDKLQGKIRNGNRAELEQLKKDVHSGKYNFMTILGQDFEDKLDELLQKQPEDSKNGKKTKEKKVRDKKAGVKIDDAQLEEIVLQELKRQERRRKFLVVFCCLVGVCCLGYVGVYSYFDYRTNAKTDQLSSLKENIPSQEVSTQPIIHYISEEDKEVPEVLDEYKSLLNKNKKLIGWVKIDDTNIDYPVMQTVDNEYYLNHNMNQEYDKNGCIFMDKDCDVLKPSTNLILYGHHMQSGKMFGTLDKFSEEFFYKEHKTFQFDTIYEKSTYEIMYVFRSRVYSEEEIVFKYYQFIDALSEQEFNSYMQEMAEMSLYDTGVTAQYGDQLLTLSTCDYQEKNGRFVVVAKKAQ